MNKAVVLLSGGLDSAVTSWIVKSEGFEIWPISFAYGQRHMQKELTCANLLASRLTSNSHLVLDTPLKYLVGSLSSLFLDSSLTPRTEETSDTIPDTWVPQRNMLFLTLAFAYAERVEAEAVFGGFNAVDYSGYPDCRVEFLTSAETTLNLARKRFVEEKHRIHLRAPLLAYSKETIVKRGMDLGVPFELTYSCYYGKEKACGRCDSCRIRLEAFRKAGIKDPISYEEVEVTFG